MPLVSARRWDTGVSAQWDGGKVEAGVAVTIGTLSSPRTDDDNGGKQISGRVGVTPAASFSVGVSGASGEFVSDPGGRTDYGDVGWLPEPARSTTHRQQALGLDAEYSLGHVAGARRGGGEPLGRAVPERRSDADARRPGQLDRDARSR